MASNCLWYSLIILLKYVRSVVMFHCFYIWFWYLYSLSLSHFFPSLYLLCQTFINCINLFKEQRRRWHPTPVLLPGKSHGQRILVGCSPWGRKELHTTDQLHFYFSLSCIGEGNGNPLQCSCLENPRDGEPGGLPSTGSHRVGHDWSGLAAAAAFKENTFDCWFSLLHVFFLFHWFLLLCC